MHSASMRGQMATMGRSSSAPTSPQMSSKRSSMFLSSLFGSSILQAPPTTPTTRPTQEPPISGAQVSPAAYTTQIRLRNDLLALMNDYNSADTTVIVGDDQVEFHSHRIMLIARSDYFRRLFQSGTQERVILSHLDPDAFRIVRRFLYTAEEEDEATSPTTDDWRLVLEAYRVTEYLGVHERSPAYHACFVNIFHRLAMELHDRETCREMWVAAEGYGLDNLLVGCAPYFWVMFGTGSNGGSGHGTGSEDLWGLLGGRLETLIKVVNAVPAHLETPIGRFRLVRAWLMGRDLKPRRRIAPTPQNLSPEVSEPPLESNGTSPTQINYDHEEGDLVDAGEYEDGEEDEEEEEEEEVGGEDGNSRAFSAPSSPTSTTERNNRKRESYLSNSTAATYTTSTPNRISTSNILKHRPSVDEVRSLSLSQNHLGLRRRGTASSLRDSAQNRRSTPSVKREIPRKAARSKVLASLDLTGISAQDLIEEVEPSGLLSDRHLLSLYRAAALQKEVLSSPSASLWMPLPCGLNGKRSLVPNPKAGHGAVSISSGQRPEALQHLETVMQLAGGGAGQLPLQNPAVAAAISALSVTFCASEPLRSGSIYTWTVVPTARERLIGIGVSADATMGSGTAFSPAASVPGLAATAGGGSSKRGIGSRLSLIGAAFGSMGDAIRSTFAPGGRETPQMADDAMSNSGYISPPALSGRASMDHLHHRGSIGGAWMDGAPPSPTMDPADDRGISPTGSLPPFPLRPPSSLDSRHFEDDIQTPVTPAHYGPTPGLPTLPPFPPLPEHHHYQSDNAYHHHHHHLSRPASTTLVPSPPAISKYVGEDGGWSLWSDGTLRVGRIFVGRLPRGVTFSRGTPITVKVDMEARTVSFDVGGVDCGVAFRNLPAVVYPSVVLGDGAAISVTRVSRVV